MNSRLSAVMVIVMTVGLTACAGLEKETGLSIRQRIAESYGLPYFDKIEKIQYTFNVKIGEKQIRRFWIWEPAVDRVTFKGMDYQESITYDRSDMARTESNKLKKVDAWFINDNYWMLFPYHVAWDTNAKVEDIGRRQLPMGEGKARCVVVTYPATGGYTPGDAYDLFLDDQYRLTHWVYRRGGTNKPTRISTWDEHRKVGPLTLSLNHQGEDPNFRVWFTNVGVKMFGSDSWLFAQ